MLKSLHATRFLSRQREATISISFHCVDPQKIGNILPIKPSHISKNMSQCFYNINYLPSIIRK